MSINDPISDLLTRIRNAKTAKHRYVDVPKSKELVSVLNILVEKGFVEKLLVNDAKRLVRAYLRYAQGRQSVISTLKRVSSPGRRYYVGYKDIPCVLSGLGVAIVSTSKGVIDGDKAKAMKLGGELLCVVW
jgi:small subunit ribosomal protein S8